MGYTEEQKEKALLEAMEMVAKWLDRFTFSYDQFSHLNDLCKIVGMTVPEVAEYVQEMNDNYAE